MNCPACQNPIAEDMTECRLCGWQRPAPQPDPDPDAAPPAGPGSPAHPGPTAAPATVTAVGAAPASPVRPAEPPPAPPPPTPSRKLPSGSARTSPAKWLIPIAVIVLIVAVASLSKLPTTAFVPASINRTPTSDSYPVVEVAQGKECARTGTGPFAAVGTANKSTTCGFAGNVRKAYLKAHPDGGDGTVTAHCPTTKKNCGMSCAGSQPVLCTGGVAGRVIIYGGELQVG